MRVPRKKWNHIDMRQLANRLFENFLYPYSRGMRGPRKKRVTHVRQYASLLSRLFKKFLNFTGGYI